MEEYKKKYEHALENLKKIKAANKDNKSLVDFIEYEYPELKESEDERIRKELLSLFEHGRDGVSHRYNGSDCERYIAWLEKQGEQKQNIIDIISDLENYFATTTKEQQEKDWDEIKDWEEKHFNHDKHIEQKPAWSEENSCYYDDICEILINLINSPKSNVNKDVVQKDLDWLMSIKESQLKSSWSEEDEKMIDLLIAIFRVNYPNEFYKTNPAHTPNMGGKHSLEIINWLKSLKERMKGE